MKLKNIIISAITGTLLATLGSSAMAQNYPRRPVEMVIPFGTGGASDILPGNMHRSPPSIWASH